MISSPRSVAALFSHFPLDEFRRIFLDSNFFFIFFPLHQVDLFIMSVNPGRILAALIRCFPDCDDSPLTRQEEKAVSTIKIIINCFMEDDDVELEQNDECELEYSPEDNRETDLDDIDGEVENKYRFNGRFIEKEKLQAAISYYRSAKDKHRSISSMNCRFRFIQTKSDMDKLREFETSGLLLFLMLIDISISEENKQNRRIALRQLANSLNNEVMKKMEAGIILHDTDLRRAALLINETLKIPNFKASLNWISKYKKTYRISSRKITKIVSKKTMNNDEKRKETAADFISNIKDVLTDIPLSAVLNADQSGFQKELYTGRTLALKGSREVHCTVQSVSSVSHSYTILPSLFASGELGKKLFLVLQEPKGCFPKKGYFPAPNLVVRCHSSHIMTKSLMLEWLQTCVFDSEMPDHLVLLLDSWTNFKDHVSIKKIVPKGKTIDIFNIPAGTTSFIQPCDVFFFRIFKDFVKKITNHVMIEDEKLVLHHRDNILKMISLVYNQFSAPIYKNFLQYSWFKAGYLTNRPPSFQTPVQFCFRFEIRSCAVKDCDKTSFICCSYCNKHLCFSHFFNCYHFHEN